VTASPPVRSAFAVSSASKPAIRLTGICKAYKMYDRPIHLLKEAISGRPYHRDKHVLTDISLTIPRGEIVGIIGVNGAGKSTLLKIIAGTLAPSQGTVEVDGRVSAILELGTGFNPNYSGRDNVILSALMRGMSEQAVRDKFDGIVAFAGLEHVIDEPFHTYSSGMQARLAFAAAVAVEADVLIIDEALAAGDARFTARSLRRIHEICSTGVTALFVSHQTYHVMQLCDRAVWIDGGRIRMDGKPVEVVRAYEYEVHEAIARDQGRMLVVAEGTDDPPTEERRANVPVHLRTDHEGHDNGPEAMGGTTPEESLQTRAPELAHVAETSDQRTTKQNPAVEPALDNGQALNTPAHPEAPRRFSTGEYRIVDIAFMDKAGQRTDAFRFGEMFRLRVSYECLLPELPKYSCGVAVAFNRVSDFEAVMYFNTSYPHSDDELATYFDKPYRKFVGRRGVVEAVVDPLQIRAGEYYVSLGILPNQPGMHEFYEYIHCQYRIKIIANGFDEPSVFYPMVSWTNGPIS
jgi:lipopolysaccharide transport system ATP-binding protein